MKKKLLFSTSLLLISIAAFGEEIKSIFGVMPGESVPNLTEYFEESPGNVYEKPLNNNMLKDYFQYIQVFVLPPKTVASISATRAYENGLKCVADMEKLQEYLDPLFPDTEPGIEYRRLSEDGELMLSLGCSTSGNTPYYSLRLYISHDESSADLRERIFGANR